MVTGYVDFVIDSSKNVIDGFIGNYLHVLQIL